MTEFGDVNEGLAVKTLTEGSTDIVEDLLLRGYSLVDLSSHAGVDTSVLSVWEECFRKAFDLPEDTKRSAGVYRSDTSTKGLAVGYRRDDNREFFETRMVLVDRGTDAQTDDCAPVSSSSPFSSTYTSSCIPTLPVPAYEQTVYKLCRVLSSVGEVLLSSIARHALHVDGACFIDLTDIPVFSVLPLASSSSSSSPTSSCIPLSSSVLRICSYPCENHNSPTDPTDASIAFGSHTDTSFLTIAPCSSVPGIEIYDRLLNRWVSPEAISSPHPSSASLVVVFTGEMLEILTKRKFQAVVHRVRTPQPTRKHQVEECASGDNDTRSRVSAPFLIRGLYSSIFLDPSKNYDHEFEDAAKKNLADLEGCTMKEVHKILDFKRMRCVKEHEGSDEGSWVLSSYGVTIT